MSSFQSMLPFSLLVKQRKEKQIYISNRVNCGGKNHKAFPNSALPYSSFPKAPNCISLGIYLLVIYSLGCM